MISDVCRDNAWEIQYLTNKIVGDCSVLISKTLTIREAANTTIQKENYLMSSWRATPGLGSTQLWTNLRFQNRFLI